MYDLARRTHFIRCFIEQYLCSYNKHFTSKQLTAYREYTIIVRSQFVLRVSVLGLFVFII